jgi:hypothetical protein
MRVQWELSFRAGRQTTLSSASSNATSPFGDDEVTDWEDDDEDGWNLPVTSKKWDPLVSQATPITEIQVKSCVLPPGLYDLCSPTSTKKEDATRGVWQRVDRDLNKRIGVYYEYIFYRTCFSFGRLRQGEGTDRRMLQVGCYLEAQRRSLRTSRCSTTHLRAMISRQGALSGSASRTSPSLTLPFSTEESGSRSAKVFALVFGLGCPRPCSFTTNSPLRPMSPPRAR